MAKCKAEINYDLEMRALAVLVESRQAMTIEQIKREDMILSGITSQKMSRILGELIDMGLLKKGKSKTLGRMLYKSVAIMIEEGYEIDDDT